MEGASSRFLDMAARITTRKPDSDLNKTHFELLITFSASCKINHKTESNDWVGVEKGCGLTSIIKMDDSDTGDF